MSVINEEGNRYGKLIVTSRSGSITTDAKETRATWNCLCDCGNSVVVAGHYLRSGDVKSCGCLKTGKKEISYNKKHGMCGTRIYRIYSHVVERCTYKTSKHYQKYGARGLLLCDEWLDKKDGFNAFMKWSNENGYRDDLTIDRIDNSKGYSPENCRWVDWRTQANNKTNNRIVEYMGERYTLSNLCALLNINRDTLKNRLKAGLKDDELSRVAMTRDEVNRLRRILSQEQVEKIKTLRNEHAMSYQKIANEIGVSYPTVRSVVLGLTYKEQI